ncbi:MAG TPA: hypothetical protein VGG06_17655 [Thermoanaerobaculia bacterium]|jgi:tetratricopeptide (TPR) repeat protein
MSLEHRDFQTLSLEDALQATRKARYRNRRCVESFLERCQEEVFRNSQKALTLVVEAPEYVERCRRSLGQDYPDFLARAYGTLGTSLTNNRSLKMAFQVFDKGRSIEASEFELAALDCRVSQLEVYCGNWRRALDLTNEAVLTFEKDHGKLRDDRSLATALTYRGIARTAAYRQDGQEDLDEAIKDLLRALESSPRWLKRTRLAALAGIGVAAVSIWFSGQSTRYADPVTIVEMMERFRASLRREDIPFNSLVDARARWILGLALFKLMGGLSDCAEKNLVDARSVLMDVGLPQFAAELTLDFHWCLVHDDRLSKALEDWSVVEHWIDVLPEKWKVTLGMWGDALRSRVLEEKVVRKVFLELRGIRNVQHPAGAAADDPEEALGW